MVSICRNTMVIGKYFKQFLKNGLKQYNLNAAEGMVLLLLMDNEARPQNKTIEKMHEIMKGQTQDQIIEEIHYDKGVMTRTMQSLESKDYVERSINSDDSRSYIFSLTKKADDLKPTLLNILKRWNDGLEKDIDQEKLEITSKALSQMANNALKLIKGEY